MIRKATAFAVVIFALASILIAANAFAQCDPGCKVLIQGEVQVGVMWVPERLPEACEYQEHWYLFQDYRYPGSDNPIDTVIRPTSERHFENLEDFRTTVEREYPGGRHITTIAIEHREDCP
ncbi:MAG: hypothetical protein K0U98_24570 [Deltaproteobacteria bacterium]|nr:hypothetical protein [Deltaproteobacteria bacterium]